MTTEFIQTIDNIKIKKKISIYELLGLIKDGKAPKKVRRVNLDFVRIYKLNSHTAVVNRTYENEYNDEDFLMDIVKIYDEVEILDEEDEFIDIEELEGTLLEPREDSNLDTKILCCLANTIKDLIKNQKKIIEKLKEEGK